MELKTYSVAKKVRIVHKYPEDLKSNFVSNIIIQHESDHFILAFFEIWPPVILGETDEEKRIAIESLEQIEAKCVARLVVSPTKMREFARAIQENLAIYEKKLIKKEEK